MANKRVQMHLDVKLTEQELLECGELMTKAMIDKAIKETEFERAKKTHKSLIQQFDDSIADLCALVSNKMQRRLVNCEIRHDYPAGVKHFFRVDNGEIVKSEVLTEEDRQEDLPLDDSEISVVN